MGGYMRRVVIGLLLCLSFASLVHAVEPVVAIHYSELTLALETMSAAGSTPTGTGPVLRLRRGPDGRRPWPGARELSSSAAMRQDRSVLRQIE